MSSSLELFGCQSGDQGRILVCGLPFDYGSSDSQGCRQAPYILRSLSHWYNLSEGPLYSLRTHQPRLEGVSISDLGNFEYDNDISRSQYLKDVEKEISRYIQRKKKILSIGGDHLVTLPILKAIAQTHSPYQVVQIDAHTDYKTLYKNTQPTNANFMSFACKEKNLKRVIQIGVRAFTSDMPMIPRKIVKPELSSWTDYILKDVPIYLTIDTDGFDPLIAPGVNYPEISGLTWDDFNGILEAIKDSGNEMIGADWVEYNAEKDYKNQVTAHSILTNLIPLIECLSRG
jgi:agmatinase